MDRFTNGFDRLIEFVSSIFPSQSCSSNSIADRQIATPAIDAPRNRFLEAASRVTNHSGYSASTSNDAPYGYFYGRHVIGDCTRFAGGIYLGHEPSDAVVIDDRYAVLPDLYKSLLNSLAASEQTGVSREYDIFNKVVHVVTDAITIDPEATLAFAHEQSLMSDKKVSLDVYIVKGFGLAHHQVLLAGYLLERLVDEGILLGTVTLDSALSALTGEVLLYQSRSGATLRFAPNERRIAEIVH